MDLSLFASSQGTVLEMKKKTSKNCFADYFAENFISRSVEQVGHQC